MVQKLFRVWSLVWKEQNRKRNMSRRLHTFEGQSLCVASISLQEETCNPPINRLYSVQCTVYSVQCTAYCFVQFKWTLCGVQCTVYSKQCYLHSVLCTSCSDQCKPTVYILEGALYQKHIIRDACQSISAPKSAVLFSVLHFSIHRTIMHCTVLHTALHYSVDIWGWSDS